jgi:hypothetical protein
MVWGEAASISAMAILLEKKNRPKQVGREKGLILGAGDAAAVTVAGHVPGIGPVSAQAFSWVSCLI